MKITYADMETKTLVDLRDRIFRERREQLEREEAAIKERWWKLMYEYCSVVAELERRQKQ